MAESNDTDTQNIAGRGSTEVPLLDSQDFAGVAEFTYSAKLPLGICVTEM